MRSLLALAALAALVLLAPAPAGAAKRMEVIVQDDSVLLYKSSYYEREVAFRQLRRLGASRLRVNVLWFLTMPESQAQATTKPSQIDYDWSIWDNLIARAKQYGIGVQFDLTGDPPTWACGIPLPPGTCDGYRPNLFEFAAFAHAAAAHFGNRVKRYSIWNEPNWFTWVRPHRQSPRIYRALYQAGYAGVKAGNPNAKVLMGETAPYFRKRLNIAPLTFIRKMVCVNKRFKRIKGARRKCPGGPLPLDGYAHHPYDFTVRPDKKRENPDDVTIANLGALNRTLNKLRKKGLIDPSKKKIPLYLTEHGYYVKRPETPRNRGLSERRRAKWAVQAFDMAQRNKRVKGMTYYVLVSPPPGHVSGFFDLGLVATNGFERPIFSALTSWIQAAIADGRVKRPGVCTVPNC